MTFSQKFSSLLTPQSQAETFKIIEFVKLSCLGREPESCRILEVGCGYGAKLKALSIAGFKAVGVEVNTEIVRANQERGLTCVTVEEFDAKPRMFDVLLVSHVIEHFTPEHLLPFLDRYLNCLKPGGALVIATPLYHPFFYDDFDHVKPYHPIGLMMIFGNNQAQVQYYARNRLALKDIWFRRSPLQLGHGYGRYISSWRTRVRQLINLLGVIIFHASGQLISHTDGWVGLFEKVPPPEKIAFPEEK